ncbi:polysaccharide pyruvyl transferase family protein [Larkinella soli]|uniref:polysaccharide pyruvyl transferase family protein n=1 Tax=Larkinella soli TaxID=1770527 RepID=UPI000FFC86DD|nr:polysaccharide pyruvyl transferase family protein [Larkinella soli]
MVIELRGVEFQNKGAELMLHAILQKVRQKRPDAVFVMERGYTVPQEKLKKNNIYYKVNYGRKKEKLISFLPVPFRRKFGFIAPQEIDVVIDGSGFAFGDLWGAQYSGERLANHIESWKKEGKKVILLPQALGPFTNAPLKAKMKTIIANADLIFARDEISYKYIKSLNPDAKNIFQKPDFTNLVKGKVPDYFDPKVHEVAIIPNSKMLEKTSANEGEAYLNMLPAIVGLVRKLGHKPYFLIHEGKKDINIAQKANEMLEDKIQIVIEDDPIHVKGLIGASKAVITSRFHGLVSALSQAVPCLATGWSHKYEMLLNDYNFREALLDVKIKEEELEEKLRLILEDKSRNAIIARLKKQSEIQKGLSNQMWEMVFDRIN